jgi:uncharacterized damage-inducible protein DinB
MTVSDLNSHFLRVLQYHHLAQLRVFALLKDHPNADPDIFKLISHVINAHLVWISRLQSDSEPFNEVWKIYDAKGLTQAEQLSQSRWESFLQSNPDFQSKIKYQNVQGQAFENTVEDIISHVFMHAMYHRGQIATRLRQSGIAPMSTDFIGFARGQFS